MPRAIATALTLALAASLAGAADVDFPKAAQQAIQAGNLSEAKRLCDQWAKAKPKDERPHLVLGRLYVKQELIDKALEAFETAREVNPLSPDPACEVGKLFLMAGMGQEAAAEFNAALKVRKGHAPALKGLAEAEALLANPYAKGVHIKLAEHNEERGLTQVRPDTSRVVTIGGRQCRATDKERRRFFLFFDVADDYLFNTNVPVRVTVEYHDSGKGRFRFRYDSADTTALDHGVHKQCEYVRKRNSNTWKTVTFELPDAKFAKRCMGADFAICSYAWGNKEDVYVSSVRVVQGGVVVTAEPEVAVADGDSACTINAKVFAPMGLAADGTVVHFAADQGTIDPQATTVNGVARAVFRPGEAPSEATITVRAGEDQRTLYVPVLVGHGEVVRRRLVLDPLTQSRGWRIESSRGSHGTLGPGENRGGRLTTRVVYKLAPQTSTSHVSFRRSMPLPGRPVSLGLWIKMASSGNRLQAILIDATGQILVYRLGVMVSQGWRRIEHDIGPPVHFRGGANDGRLHLPARLEGLQIGRYYNPVGKASGEVCVQDLTVLADVPRSVTETVIMDADLAEPDRDLGRVSYLPRPAAFRVGLTHLGDGAKLGRLCWQVADERDEVVAEGRSADLRIDSGSQLSVPLTVALSEPGAYCARFTLELDGQGEQTSTEMRFLALRPMPQGNPAGEIRRQEKDIALRLDNRTDKATEFALSYRLVNAQYEVLLAGMPDEPKIKLEPGEVLDVSVSLKGFAPGRYRALLLFDMPGGPFTQLLPFDVYPSAATVTVKVVGKDDRPIRGATLRGRLVRRPHSRIDTRDRTLQKWHVQTDAAGLCELPELRIPNDVDLCRLYLNAVAEGFVDHQRAFGLSNLISPDGRPRPASTLRITPGHRLTGRVVGSDGEPVSHAVVCAMGMIRKKRRISYFHFHEPRKTDAEGRFQLSVAPAADMELTVYASQWAPKRIVLSAGKRDSGDIQLEPGATVTGTLVDENGEPASGYWVVAEASSRGSYSTVVSSVMVAAKTGPDGAFALPPLKGEFVVSTPASFQRGIAEERKHSPHPRLTVLPQTLTFNRDPVELALRGVPQVSVAGRVLDIDGTPAKNVSLHLICTEPSCRVMFDKAATGDDGRFAFEGIPRGLKAFTVLAPAIRRWERDKGIYLRARPVTHGAQSLRSEQAVLKDIERDVLDLDFQFCFWSSKHGFMDTSPDGKPVPRPQRKRGLMEGLGAALQGLAKNLAQTTSLTGRVLDEAGNGLPGAQVRVEVVRHTNEAQEGKEQPIGLWNVAAGADGKYAVAAVPMPQQPDQCRVRVQITAKGYTMIKKELSLRELVTPGARALRVPDLRVAREARE